MTGRGRYVLIFATGERVVREAVCNEAAEKTKEEKSGEIGEVSPLYLRQVALLTLIAHNY